MHTLTQQEARQAGYEGWAEHLPTVPCPRQVDPKVYCATCQGGIAQLGTRARAR